MTEQPHPWRDMVERSISSLNQAVSGVTEGLAQIDGQMHAFAEFTRKVSWLFEDHEKRITRLEVLNQPPSGGPIDLPPKGRLVRYWHMPWKDADGNQLTIVQQVDTLEHAMTLGFTGPFLYSGGSFKVDDPYLVEIRKRPSLDACTIWFAPRNQNLDDWREVLASLTPEQLSTAVGSHGQERENDDDMKPNEDGDRPGWAIYRAEAHEMSVVTRESGAQFGAQLNFAIVQFEPQSYGGVDAWAAMWDPADVDVVGGSFFNFYQKDVATPWVKKVSAILYALFPDKPKGGNSIGWSVPLDAPPDDPRRHVRAQAAWVAYQALITYGMTDHDSWYGVIYGATDEHGVRSYDLDGPLIEVLQASIEAKARYLQP